MFFKICSGHTKLPFKITHCRRISRKIYQNHYEVLKLRKNCTAKEIKSAFIKLSKEHHPDVNKSVGSHTNFQKINEAYKVLGKAETRREYDLGLGQNDYSRYEPYYHEAKIRRNMKRDPSFWSNRDRTRDEFYKDQPYYGIKGVPKLSNNFIVFFCLWFTFVGACIQYLAIKHSFTLKRDVLIKKSMESEKILHDSRMAAHHNGNTVQLEVLKNKILKETKN